MKIKKPIVQYNESDWDFIIRVASRCGIGVYPLGSDSIGIGFNNGNKQEKSVAVLDNLWHLNKNEYGEIGYLFDSQNVLLGGDEVVLWTDLVAKTKVPLNVHSGVIELIKNTTYSRINLVQEIYKYPYIPNRNIAGKGIEGIVEEVFEENEVAKMRVNLSEGLKKIAAIKFGFKYKQKKSLFRCKWSL